jgi:hypothetical protein
MLARALSPTRSSLAPLSFLVGAAALAVACNSSVSIGTGGMGGAGAEGGMGGLGGAGGDGGSLAGAGGIGGAGATGGTGGSAGGAGGASGGTGGAGGAMGNLCDQACGKAAGCGLPICQFAGVDCAMPGVDCPAQCILDADCGAINSLATMNPDPVLSACLQGCQGGGGGAGGMGMGGAGGGSPMDCGACAQQAGCPQQCQGPGCNQWGQCAFGCFQTNPTPQCFAQCNAQVPQAAMGYEQVYDCLCTSCEAECLTTVDACNQPL